MDGNTLLQYARFQGRQRRRLQEDQKAASDQSYLSAAERRNFNIQATQSGWEITW